MYAAQRIFGLSNIRAQTKNDLKAKLWNLGRHFDYIFVDSEHVLELAVRLSVWD